MDELEGKVINFDVNGTSTPLLWTESMEAMVEGGSECFFCPDCGRMMFCYRDEGGEPIVECMSNQNELEEGLSDAESCDRVLSSTAS